MKLKNKFFLLVIFNLLLAGYFYQNLTNSYKNYRYKTRDISWGENYKIKQNEKYNRFLSTLISKEEKQYKKPITRLLIATKPNPNVQGILNIRILNKNNLIFNGEINPKNFKWGFIEINLSKQVKDIDSLEIEIYNNSNKSINFPKTIFNKKEKSKREIHILPIYFTNEPYNLLSSRISYNLPINISPYLLKFLIIATFLNISYLLTFLVVGATKKTTIQILISVLFWLFLIFNLNYYHYDNLGKFGAYKKLENKLIN